MVAYLACPYMDPDVNVRKKRLATVTQVAHDLIKQGLLVYSPLTHNIPIDQLGIHGDWHTWRTFDLEMLGRCDRLIVLKLDGWDRSSGVTAEIAHAESLGLPIESIEVSHAHKPNESETESASLSDLLSRLLHTYAEREWGQFHSPKNLVMDLCSEIGELTEHFRWLSEPESYIKPSPQLDAIQDEVADVFLSLIHLAHALGIDPVRAGFQKLAKIAAKYPVEKCKGRSDKYTAYQAAPAMG